MKKRAWKVTTPQQFEAVKALANAGASTKTIATATNKSVATVGRMLKFDTLEEYRAYIRANRAKYVQKAEPVIKVAVVPAIETQLSDNANQVFDFKLLNENLVLLANKLDKYALACEQLTIATYASRKTTKELNESKPFWKS